jgi:hypothetical protein
MIDSPSNLIAAVRYFADKLVCNAYMRQIKWPSGEIACHHCGSLRIGNSPKSTAVDSWASNDGATLKKPKGFKAFDSLMQKLVRVPSAEIPKASKPAKKKPKRK